MKKIVLVAVFCVLGFALLGQAQGHLFLRIDHKDVALEVGGSEGGIVYDQPDVYIALFSEQFGGFTDEHWVFDNKEYLDDFRDLSDSLRQYVTASNKVFTCIYPSDYYSPEEEFQVLGVGDTVLFRGVNLHSNRFIAIKLSLDETRKVADALSGALTLAKKP